MFPTVPRVMCAQRTVLSAFPLRLGLKSRVCRSGHPGVSKRISLPCLNGLHFREKKTRFVVRMKSCVWCGEPAPSACSALRLRAFVQTCLCATGFSWGASPGLCCLLLPQTWGSQKIHPAPQSRECLVHLFRVFCFRATPSNAQGLLLTLCSGITSGSAQGILCSTWH